MRHTPKCKPSSGNLITSSSARGAPGGGPDSTTNTSRHRRPIHNILHESLMALSSSMTSITYCGGRRPLPSLSSLSGGASLFGSTSSSLSSGSRIHVSHRSSSSSATSLVCLRAIKEDQTSSAIASSDQTSSSSVTSASQAASSASAAGFMSDPELWKQMQVKDVCTKPALSISPDASVLDAMKVLVEKRISGLPVADESGHVVGVISGYDLLLLESTPGHIDTSEGLFPPIGRCDEYGGKKELMWNSFNELRNAQARVRGESVGDVMHECTTISQDASLEDAASVLLANKQHRLAVVDDDGKLCGILSRGDILRSTLESLQGYCTFEA